MSSANPASSVGMERADRLFPHRDQYRHRRRADRAAEHLVLLLSAVGTSLRALGPAKKQLSHFACPPLCRAFLCTRPEIRGTPFAKRCRSASATPLEVTVHLDATLADEQTTPRRPNARDRLTGPHITSLYCGSDGSSRDAALPSSRCDRAQVHTVSARPKAPPAARTDAHRIIQRQKRFIFQEHPCAFVDTNGK